jgi:hypothetical protein
LHGKGSTAQIAIAQKPIFQPNLEIRCLVFVIFEKKKFGNILEIFSYKIKIFW